MCYANEKNGPVCFVFTHFIAMLFSMNEHWCKGNVFVFAHLDINIEEADEKREKTVHFLFVQVDRIVQ